MKRNILLLFAVVYLVIGTIDASAQTKTVAPYSITAIRVMPYEASQGKFLDELKPDEFGGYFNDLDKSLLVLVEVTGPAGEYVTARRVSVRVTEGKKVKLTKVGYPGVLNENGKYWVPIWLEAAMCDEVTITASMTGQTKKSSMKRTLNFMCGE
ncbi:MAG TPA: hypothetical protein PKA82_05110 [Pyrinomonadaceae bacterium]|nr:hypothetical protein [Pyrinomonadaceae bacterium]